MKRNFQRILKKHWFIIVLCAIVACSGLIVFLTLNSHPEFEEIATQDITPPPVLQEQPVEGDEPELVAENDTNTVNDSDVVFEASQERVIIYPIEVIPLEKEPELPTSAVIEEPKVSEAEEETKTNPETRGEDEEVQEREPEKEQEQREPRHYIIIGDSRVVGLEQTTNISRNENIDIIAKTSMGCEWLVSEALYAAEDSGIDNYVIMMGLNDLRNIDRYIETYQALVIGGKHVVVATIGPVEEGKSYSVTQEEVEEFNEEIRKLNGVKVLDLYKFLVDTGYSTTDGVHYTGETYYDIQGYLLNNLDV